MAARRVDVVEVPGGEFHNRWMEAQDRIKGVDRELQAGFPGNALILAVQAVIAANDAFTIRNLGERCASDRHEDAEAVFARVKAVPGTKEARGHLVKLLKAKGSIEYSGKPVDREKAQRLSEHARRFVEFVRKNLK